MELGLHLPAAPHCADHENVGPRKTTISLLSPRGNRHQWLILGPPAADLECGPSSPEGARGGPSCPDPEGSHLWPLTRPRMGSPVRPSGWEENCERTWERRKSQQLRVRHLGPEAVWEKDGGTRRGQTAEMGLYVTAALGA